MHTKVFRVCVCAHTIKYSEETRNIRELGGGSEIAKVSLAFNVIYWHITWLMPPAHTCMWVVRACVSKCEKCERAPPPSLCPTWTVQSLFHPHPPTHTHILVDSLVLYWCSLSYTITLCPSLAPIHSSFSPLSLPHSSFVQFNHGGHTPVGFPPFSSGCYILLGEI